MAKSNNTALIVIVLLVLFGLSVVAGVVGWYVFLKPPGNLPENCKNSYYLSNAPFWKFNSLGKVCANQQPPHPELSEYPTNDIDSSIVKSFQIQWGPKGTAGWCEDTYYSINVVDKNGRSGPSSTTWNKVPKNENTLPTLSWSAGPYTNSSDFGFNIRRSPNPDGSASQIVGKAIYNATDSRYVYVDFDLSPTCFPKTN